MAFWQDATYEEMQQRTELALTHPLPGDHFHEMYSFHVFVVQVTDGGMVTTMEASPPCEFPKDGKVMHQTRKSSIADFITTTIQGHGSCLGE